jgi:DNA repair protein RecN (Recombination protein N)
MDPSAEVILEKNHLALEAINQLLNILTKRLEEPQMDPEKLHKLELRMDLFQRLKRKYGKSINDLESVATKAEEELCRLEHIEETLSALKKEMEVSYTEAKKIADQLHLKRIEAAKELSHSVENELRELGFLQAMFKVCINTSDELESTGFDRVEFMFAPNPGEAARPLKMIASSGEMARVMLAIKTTLASVDEVPVLIFDEIDANVGGTTATKVGAKLQNLGKWHQVICITHLPQVAAFGDRHYLVEKHLNDERTFTRLRLLSDQERRAEIARMLGGKHQEALALANKLIREAAKNEAMLFSE